LSRRDFARREREGRWGRERRKRWEDGEGEKGGAMWRERRGSREEGRGSEGKRRKQAGCVEAAAARDWCWVRGCGSMTWDRGVSGGWLNF
jgi:hypothetical protein